VPSKAGHASLLRKYLGPQRGAAALTGVFLLCGIALALAGPVVASTFIRMVQSGATVSSLVGVAVFFLVVTSAQQAMKALATYWSERVGWTATNQLRGDLLAHVLGMDLSFHESRSSGELIERIDGDVNEINDFFSRFVALLLGNILLLAGILVMLTTIDPWVGLIFGVLALAGVGALLYVGSLGVPQWKDDRQEGALFYGYLSETLHAREDLRSLGAERYAMARFLQRLRAWLPVKLRATAWVNLVWLVSIALVTGITVLAYLFGSGLFYANRLDISGVYLIVAYAMMLMAPMEAIKEQLAYLQQATAAVIRVRELLAVRSELASGTTEIPEGRPLSVRFDHVNFRYPGSRPAGADPDARATALRDVSFELPAGRVLALVGRTGAGKSTIAHLLFRLYDPQAGTVRVGEVDLRDARLASLRENIGLVTQDVHIFDASVRDNLTFFDETVPDRRLTEVLAVLGRAEWLDGLPDGLDTTISAGSLSAGEAQLVAFARVFLKDPGLVILDEASSRLDGATEQLMDRAMDGLLGNRTAIIIAHRLETMWRADDVLMIEDGRVVEHDTAASLLSDGDSRFAMLHRVGDARL
jgi:ABC-type multidrug transport system fused ATPase/permease subunit